MLSIHFLYFIVFSYVFTLKFQRTFYSDLIMSWNLFLFSVLFYKHAIIHAAHFFSHVDNKILLYHMMYVIPHILENRLTVKKEVSLRRTFRTPKNKGIRNFNSNKKFKIEIKIF
jgi:hypothetical protein